MMRRRYEEVVPQRPTEEETKSLILKNLSTDIITSGKRSVDSISVRLMTLNMASTNLLSGKYDTKIEMLYKTAKQEASGQNCDNKSFSQGLVNDLIKLTSDILKELI